MPKIIDNSSRVKSAFKLFIDSHPNKKDKTFNKEVMKLKEVYYHFLNDYLYTIQGFTVRGYYLEDILNNGEEIMLTLLDHKLTCFDVECAINRFWSRFIYDPREPKINPFAENSSPSLLVKQVLQFLPLARKKDYDIVMKESIAVVEAAVDNLNLQFDNNSEQKEANHAMIQYRNLRNLYGALKDFNEELQIAKKNKTLSDFEARLIASKAMDLADTIVNPQSTIESKNIAIMEFEKSIMSTNKTLATLLKIGIGVVFVALLALLFSIPFFLTLSGIISMDAAGIALIFGGMPMYFGLLATFAYLMDKMDWAISRLFSTKKFAGHDKIMTAAEKCIAPTSSVGLFRKKAPEVTDNMEVELVGIVRQKTNSLSRA
jgi:hypothetical protein